MAISTWSKITRSVGPNLLLLTNFYTYRMLQQFFKTSQTIFPHSSAPVNCKAFTLPKGTTMLPFQLKFPVFSMCQKTNVIMTHLQTTLPPSFSFRSKDNNGSAEIRYQLCVKVFRPCGLYSNIDVKRELQFLPLDPLLPPPMIEPRRRRSSGSNKSSVSGSAEIGSVKVEVSIPSPAILWIGSPIPVGISIKTEERPTIMRTLAMIVRVKIVQSMNQRILTRTSPHEIMSLSGLNISIPCRSDLQSICENLLHNAKIPENITPSFTTCTLMQEYSLVVIVGFSTGAETTIDVRGYIFYLIYPFLIVCYRKWKQSSMSRSIQELGAGQTLITRGIQDIRKKTIIMKGYLFLGD